MCTKVAITPETSKLTVTEHQFMLFDNGYKVFYSYDDNPSVRFSGLVTIDKIFEHVANEEGMVDTSLISPTGEAILQTIDFDHYMNYEFDREAKAVLGAIVRKNGGAIC